MYTVVETPTFKADADQVWTEEERLAFITWLATHPDAGVVIPGSGGCRKVRWSIQGHGKRGGARVVYFTLTAEGEIWLLLLYLKNARDNIPAHILRSIREEIEHG